MNFQALNKSPKDQTLLIKSSCANANIRVPHAIKWSEITLPSDWTLATESQPTPIQNNLQNLDYIQQYLDVTVKINFGNQPLKSSVQLKQLPTPSQSHRHNPARHSFAGSSSTLERDLEMEKTIRYLRKSSQVNHPLCNNTKKPTEENEGPTSPTQTDFESKAIPVDSQIKNIQ